MAYARQNRTKLRRYQYIRKLEANGFALAPGYSVENLTATSSERYLLPWRHKDVFIVGGPNPELKRKCGYREKLSLLTRVLDFFKAKREDECAYEFAAELPDSDPMTHAEFFRESCFVILCPSAEVVRISKSSDSDFPFA
jgi:hypothetical protein